VTIYDINMKVFILIIMLSSLSGAQSFLAKSTVGWSEKARCREQMMIPTPVTTTVVKTPAIATIGALLWTISNGIKVVRQSDVMIVERLGKYHAQLNPGLHFLIPLVDRVRAIVTQVILY